MYNIRCIFLENDEIVFWNGILKGVIITEETLEDFDCPFAGKDNKNKMCLKMVKNLKEEVERLHGDDILNFLKKH